MLIYFYHDVIPSNFVIFFTTQVYVTYEEEKNKSKNFSLQKRNFYLSVGASQVGVYQGLDYYTGLSCS